MWTSDNDLININCRVLHVPASLVILWNMTQRNRPKPLRYYLLNKVTWLYIARILSSRVKEIVSLWIYLFCTSFTTCFTIISIVITINSWSTWRTLSMIRVFRRTCSAIIDSVTRLWWIVIIIIISIQPWIRWKYKVLLSIDQSPFSRVSVKTWRIVKYNKKVI